jgi:diaminohydroxyphosphoribosylaminopyrimidine deaminase / 5-amino-6-(5-phosphoribosylamino)uracil reductase
MTSDEWYMRRAFELAGRGVGSVSPNPRVGCVIVCDDVIIGEGWHQKFGEAHAEVHAVQSVADKSLLGRSTVFVNLEPCAHTGKTPPCADMLISHHIKKVVVSNIDTNPLVGGNGIKKLKSAGVDVITGVLEKEGRLLNARFFTWIEKHRPYIILKWAQTADGYIARRDNKPQWISHELSRKYVHRWRSEEDAILVGTQTALIDNPKLNVREWTGRDPVRMVIDKSLRLPGSLHLWQGPQQTICYTLKKKEHAEAVQYVQLQGRDFLNELLQDAFERNVQSIIVEGGAKTLHSFLDNKCWDEARVITSTISFGDGIAAPVPRGTLVGSERILSDELKIYHA